MKCQISWCDSDSDLCRNVQVNGSFSELSRVTWATNEFQIRSGSCCTKFILIRARSNLMAGARIGPKSAKWTNLLGVWFTLYQSKCINCVDNVRVSRVILCECCSFVRTILPSACLMQLLVLWCPSLWWCSVRVCMDLGREEFWSQSLREVRNSKQKYMTTFWVQNPAPSYWPWFHSGAGIGWLWGSCVERHCQYEGAVFQILQSPLL